jgi:hypothetical protein
MNAKSKYPSNRLTQINASHPPTWQMMVVIPLVAWLSVSLFLDLVLMPGMYGAGMMREPGFAMAGDFIFSVFNRMELLAAATVLTGCLICQATRDRAGLWLQWSILGLAGLLLVIPLIYTYSLTPHMSELGVQLNIFEAAPEVPAGMNQLHGVYWGLESLKLCVGVFLLSRFWNQDQQLAQMR